MVPKTAYMLHEGQEKSCSNIFLKFANISHHRLLVIRDHKVVAAKPMSAMDWVSNSFFMKWTFHL